MVIMALDHARDYFSGYVYDPTDLQHASTIIFFTRWITHFCAPVFVFLSGTSVFLSLSKRESKKHAAWRLFTRGLWLIFLEVTVIRYGWMFDVEYKLVILQVIWAIGWSMIFLSGFIFLPRAVILAIGMVMIFGHNAFDNFHPTGNAGILWQVLHIQSPINLSNGDTIFVVYPLIPWIGVMAVGYCFGAIFKKEESERNKQLYLIGISAIALFIVLRFINVYGDPLPWQMQQNGMRTLISFINCTKYPPSLLYLLMTIGPAIAVMPLLEQMNGKTGDIFKVYGRVPFFYYVLHIYILHTASLLAQDVLHAPMITGIFAHPAYPLYIVYACWIGTVALLYLPCKWFMNVKMRYKHWWLSYL
jgi:uncharacterized membrane protein